MQIQNILYYAILDYTSSEEIEIRENCKDYKDCIRNARKQAAISAADKLGACVASAFVPVVGGWALLGGFVWATASTMMSYSSEKNACCDTAARNAGCCN